VKKNPEKVSKVMREFKSGDLKSSSGKKVTNPKQAIAIALSEAGKSKPMKEGGHMKESKAMVKKEVSFMKKKGAPKSMIKHEMAEAGMKPKAKYMSFTEKGKPAGMKTVQMASGGKVKKMALGGMAAGAVSGFMGNKAPAYAKPYVGAASAPARSSLSKLNSDYQKQKAFNPQTAKLTPAHFAEQAAQARAAADFQKRNTSNLKQGLGGIKKMAAGGLAAGHKSADGVAKKGKTDTKQVTMKKGGAVKKMRYGGKC